MHFTEAVARYLETFCPPEQARSVSSTEFQTEPCSVSLHHWIYHIYKISKISPSGIIQTCILLEKIHLAYPSLHFSNMNIRRLFLVGAMVISKVYEDITYRNKDWAVISSGSFVLEQINQMEVELLSLLDFYICITPEEYSTFVTYLYTEYQSKMPMSVPPSAFLPKNVSRHNTDVAGYQEFFITEQRRNQILLNHLDEILTQVGKDDAQSASSLLSIVERQTSLREEHEVLTLDAVKKGKTIQEIQEALQTLTTTVESDGIRLDELDNRVDEQEEITQQTLKEHSQLIKHHINQQPNSLDSQLQNHLDDPSTVSVDFFDHSNSNAPAVGPTTSPIFKQRSNTPKGKQDATQKLGSTELSKYPVLITEEHSPPHPSHPALSQASPMKQDKSPVGQGRGGDTEELSAPETVLRVDKARIESTI
ncbi:hypothetical protein BLNAU_20292 [Blattamonas nauphoetae]|uniref:Cyclin N-terminal domain-containing protein n=1 Tax=Blattamonas nauphoetae TaxID=2049346 RepID=A0ABQ9WZ33_9EUKA|nr:hypothetical protein BLNAU_20292 [Blattamonas nauphoetae]